MASVILTTLWLNSAADLSDFASFPGMTSLKSTPAVQGIVKQYATGRLRAITRAGSQNQVAATLTDCSPDQVEWLTNHSAQLVLVRDDRGRKFYGIYGISNTASTTTTGTLAAGSAAYDEHPFDGNTDVTVTFYEVTNSEAV